MALMLSKGGHPVSLHEYKFTKRGSDWIPERSRVTLFDSLGRARTVLTHDFSALRSMSPGAANLSSRGLGSV